MMLSFGPLTQLLDNCYEAVVTVDEDGCIAYFNPAAEQLFGHGADDVLGDSVNVLVPHRFRPQHAAHVRAFLESGQDSRRMGASGEIRALHKSGDEFVVEGTISKVTIDNRVMLTAIFRDITERRKTEEILRLSEEKHRAIVDSAPDAILIASADTGIIRDVNAMAAEMFRCARTDLIGLHQEQLHPPDERPAYRRIFREHIELGRIKAPDGSIQRMDGSRCPVSITARPTRIFDEPFLVGFFRDISEEKRRESELERARMEADAANRAKSEFLANMSHELRTPLNAVLGFSEVIRDRRFGDSDTAVYADYACHIHDSGRHLSDIIEQLLDVSRLEAGRAALREEVFEVPLAIEECLNMVSADAQRQDVWLRSAVSANLPSLFADRRAFKQIVANLLSNAIKFARAGDLVTVTAGVAASGWLEIGVIDTGPGIPQTQQRRVLEPFTRGEGVLVARSEGSGIGLHLARSMARLHDGELELASEEGRGTRVTLRLPPQRLCTT